MLRLLPTFSVGMMSRGLTGRGYTTSPVKASVALVAKLRKETSIPMSKARQALIQHNNDYEATLKWIQEQEVSAGEDKAAKLEGREVKDGLLGVVSHQGKGAMIEVSAVGKREREREGNLRQGEEGFDQDEQGSS